MRARLEIYDYDGKRISIKNVSAHFASKEKVPHIEIMLPDGLKLTKNVMGSVYLYLKGLPEEIKKHGH